MSRIISLDPPHKGLRNALSKLLLTAGKTNYSSISSVKLLKELSVEVFHLLKDHTATENKFILEPLKKRNPTFTQHYFSDHVEIEFIEQQLFERIMSLTGEQTNEFGHQLYVDLCKFQSDYLAHLHEEDSVLEIEMQKLFSDEELMQHQIEIMKEMSFDTLLLWFKYIVPARRPEENAQVLTGFKSVAPETAYSTVLSTIKNEISESEFELILSLIK
jgi:hypothetical protein